MSKNIKIILIIAIITCITYFIYQFILNSNSDWKISSNLINVSIPKDTNVIQSTNTHGGFLGDGEYFAIFQFSENQYKEFFDKANQNNYWNNLPLPDDLNTFIFGKTKIIGDRMESYEGHGENKIPNNIKNAKYYFRDKYVEDYPEYKGTSILDKERYASNFIFAILDSDSKKLYVLKYDA